MYSLKLLSLCLSCLSVSAIDVEYLVKKEPVFLYFAYGPNMLGNRMRMKLTDVDFYGPARLKKHRLDFAMEVSWWNGAIATICKDKYTSVWGVLWTVKQSDIDKLDEQEGVYQGWFHPQQVKVETVGGKKHRALTYVQNLSPRKLPSFEMPPPERLPSATYMKTMIVGAVQGNLPFAYIQYLYSVRHNGKRASEKIIEQLAKPRRAQIKALL